MNLARDIGPLLLNAGVQVLGQFGQALFGLGQLLHGTAACQPGFVHFHRALDDMGQAADLVFEQVVADAQSHDIHRRRFANGTRQQHKWRGVGAGANQFPDIQRREAGQVVVRQNQVERLFLQSVFDSGQSVYRREGAGQRSALETQPRQGLICDRVFNMEDFHVLIL